MKKYYQAVMVMAHGSSKHYSTLFNSFEEAKEWVDNELYDEKKYEYLGHIEISTSILDENDLIHRKEINYYYEW